MLKHLAKRTIVCLLSAALAVAGLCGCGMNENASVLTVGSEDVSLGVANFAARYTQATYETYYGISDTSWAQNVDEETTYEEMVKKEVMDNLKQMVLERQHMGDYDIELTEDEQKKIDEAAETFVNDNDETAKEATTASKDSVSEYLELMTVSHKVEDAVKDAVDTEVSDDEAAQKKMQYAYFAFSSTDEAGNVELFEDDEKEAVKKTADEFAAAAADAGDFEAAATEAGATVEEATFDADSTDPDATLAAEAYKLKEGQVTSVVEGETGYYVAKVTSDLDREATDTKKEEIVSERQTKAVEDAVKKWKKDTKIKVHKRQWKKVSFEKQGITMKIEETQETTDGE